MMDENMESQTEKSLMITDTTRGTPLVNIDSLYSLYFSGNPDDWAEVQKFIPVLLTEIDYCRALLGRLLLGSESAFEEADEYLHEAGISGEL